MQGSKTAYIMEKHNIRAHKKYGQNFLRDDNILLKIVECSGVTVEDTVLEIGPGLGALTSALAAAAKNVIAVEIDKDLIPVLKDTLKEYDNIEIICGDILKIDIKDLLEERGITGPVKVVANLPYYITTPVIMKLLEDIPGDIISSITVMVQNEVARRMQAGPGTKDYGALSLAVQYRAKASIVLKVSPECFIPRPGVDSAVIRLDIYPKDERPFKAENEALLFSIIRASFNQRRKMLVNSLINAGINGVTREKMEQVLTLMDIPVTIRGEALNLHEFIALSDKIGT